MRKRKGEKVLRPIRSNAGIEAEYRRKLRRLIEDMHKSVDFWVQATYRANPPRMALDEAPAKELEREIRRLSKRWLKDFNDAAPKLARWFALKNSRRSETALMKILKDAGITVKFTMTPQMRDAFEAVVAENVQLIRSIPEQYLTQVQGSVMRSVQAGRDLSIVAKDLQRNYGVSYRRAALISRDQNNKATAVMTRARQEHLGIEEAIWMHSHAGKKPRPTHLRNDGKRYKVAEGWYDPDPRVARRIWPGELINCRCTTKAIVKGFS